MISMLTEKSLCRTFDTLSSTFGHDMIINAFLLDKDLAAASCKVKYFLHHWYVLCGKIHLSQHAGVKSSYLFAELAYFL